MQEQDSSYTLNDTVGKAGIEQVMELQLQGKKGSETIYVDNLGKIIETTDVVESQSGNNLYLSIDSDLQMAIYSILEQKIAGIIALKMRNVMNYDASSVSSAGNLIIPIDDVYYALFNNSVIDITHFTSDNADVTEREVYQIFLNKQQNVLNEIKDELQNKKTPYDQLSKRV